MSANPKKVEAMAKAREVLAAKRAAADSASDAMGEPGGELVRLRFPKGMNDAAKAVFLSGLQQWIDDGVIAPEV